MIPALNAIQEFDGAALVHLAWVWSQWTLCDWAVGERLVPMTPIYRSDMCLDCLAAVEGWGT